MSYNTNVDISMGCLADIRLHLRNNEAVKEITAHLYSSVYPCCYYSNEEEQMGKGREGKEWAVSRVRVLASHVINALPSRVYYSNKMIEKALMLGHVTMKASHNPALVHSRLAPFRLFIECPDSTDFFIEAEKYGTMGAFIASHMFTIDRIATLLQGKVVWKEIHGWHQSMFPGIRGGNLFRSIHIRRVVALHPSLRHHLGEGTTLFKTYMICDLKRESEDKVLAALYAAKLGDSIDPNEDMKGCVERFQLWYDTIVHSLSEEI